MEMEFKTKEFPYWRPVLRQMQAQEQTQEIRLTEDLPDVGRILGIWGQVIHRAKEWRGDSVNFSGGILVYILFAGEDGTNHCMESWMPFQCRWEPDNLTREGVARIQCRIRSLDARTVSARKIVARCSLGAVAEISVPEKAMIAEPCEISNKVELLKVRYPVVVPREAGEKAFRVEEVISLPGNLPAPVKIVSSTVEPALAEAKVIGNKIVFRGNAELHLVYMTEEGEPVSADLQVPFSQFIQLEEDISAEGQPDLQIGITGLELEQDQNGTLQLKCGMVAQYMVDDRQMLELVEDAYSPGLDVQPKASQLELPAVLEQKQVPISVNQILRQPASQILDVVYRPDFPGIYRRDEVQFQLPGQFQVLYRDGEQTLQSALVRTEESWDLPAEEHVRLDAMVIPGECGALATGDSIALKAEMKLRLRCTARNPIPMVVGLTVGEEKKPDPARPSLILRRAGGQRLWDIAKSTGSTVAGIRQANALEQEPEENRILLIPVN